MTPKHSHEKDKSYHKKCCFQGISHCFLRTVIENFQQFTCQKDEIRQLKQDEKLY